MVNSSPPRRASVSPRRRVSFRRLATPRRRRSPSEWPKVSLTSLKRSISTNITARLPFLRWAWAMASSRRSLNRHAAGRRRAARLRQHGGAERVAHEPHAGGREGRRAVFGRHGRLRDPGVPAQTGRLTTPRLRALRCSANPLLILGGGAASGPAEPDPRRLPARGAGGC